MTERMPDTQTMELTATAAEKLLDASGEAVIVVNDEGTIVFVNPQAEELFGYRREELLGDTIERLLPDEDRARHSQYRQRYRGAPHARPLVSGLSLRGQRKNGEVFDAEIALTPIDNGKDQLVASTVRDISGGDASEAYFRHLLQAAPDAMIIVDENGRIAIANDQSEKMFGYSHDDLIGKPIEMLLPVSVHQRHREHRRKFMEEPGLRPMGIGMDLFARRADGTEFPVEISLSPVRAASGMFVSSVIRDVTRRRDMERDLIAARQAAERAHKANTAFLAAASHDLRQPVQALSLLNGALRRTVRDELALEMVESQRHSLDAMTNLLNSLLDISRLDAGAITPEIEEFPMQRLIDRLSSEFGRQSRQKGLTFIAHPAADVIRSDANLLAEIIQNLVSNAIRYTNEGKVELRCREDGDNLVITVADTGIGIDEEHIESIFREFHQLKTHASSNEGFGLGLAIVRRLCDLLGHRIAVESAPGEGSVFSLTVPRVGGVRTAVAETRRADAPGDQAGGGRTILLIEDDRNVAAAWSMLLKADGYRVSIADSASAAADVAAGLDAPPDLIISDYHLVDGSTGVQAVAAVRAAFGLTTPAFIVSGDTSKVVDDARRVSNSIVLSKPVNTDELLERARHAVLSGDAGTT